jgi:hypothetical protein
MGPSFLIGYGVPEARKVREGAMSGWPETSTTGGPPSPIDTKSPSVARLYDYLLGGKDNFEVDRRLGDQIKRSLPEVHIGVQQQRAVLRRVVRHLVGEVGLRQLIDIGAGLPTADNVHQIAHELDPDTRVVYVDNDPIVLNHARALLADCSTTIVIEGDLLKPEGILGHPQVATHIDFSQPVGVLLCGILHYLTDDDDPASIVSRLTAPLAPGSHLFIHHLVSTDDEKGAKTEALLRQGVGNAIFRPVAEVRRFFAGLDMVEPGLVPVPHWRPDRDTPTIARHPVLRLAVAGVGRKGRTGTP